MLTVGSGTLVGVVLPGSTLLVALGLWAHHAPGALLPAIVVAATATVTGAHLGWWRGRAGRRGVRGGSWFADRGPLSTVALLALGHRAAAARPLTVLGVAGWAPVVAVVLLAGWLALRTRAKFVGSGRAPQKARQPPDVDHARLVTRNGCPTACRCPRTSP